MRDVLGAPGRTVPISSPVAPSQRPSRPSDPAVRNVAPSAANVANRLARVSPGPSAPATAGGRRRTGAPRPRRRRPRAVRPSGDEAAQNASNPGSRSSTTRPSARSTSRTCPERSMTTADWFGRAEESPTTTADRCAPADRWAPASRRRSCRRRPAARLTSNWVPSAVYCTPADGRVGDLAFVEQLARARVPHPHGAVLPLVAKRAPSAAPWSDSPSPPWPRSMTVAEAPLATSRSCTDPPGAQPVASPRCRPPGHRAPAAATRRRWPARRAPSSGRRGSGRRGGPRRSAPVSVDV